jgi:tetratricopeptide (TPR) repeat protein
MPIFSKKRIVLRWFIASVLAAIALMGCYLGPVSKNPISGPDPDSVDHKLLGTWGLVISGKKYTIVHFEIADKKKGTIKAYLFNFTESWSPKTHIYYGHFSRLGDSRYLNLYEIRNSDHALTPQIEKEDGSQKVPSYFFVKYEIKGKTLSMALMDRDFVMASIRNDEIKGIIPKDGMVEINDDPSEIAEYIMKHEKEVFEARVEFGGSSSLVRVKYQERELEILKRLTNWPSTHIKTAQDYDKIIELYPKDVVAYYIRGSAYKAKGDYDRAIQDFSKAIELDPKYEQAYYSRGDAYKAKGDYDMAIQDYSKVIELDPSERAYDDRANAYKNKGDYDRAIQDYSKLIEWSPKEWSLKEGIQYYIRGETYKDKGDYDRAIQDFSKAIELRPDYEYAYLLLVIASMRKSQHDYETSLEKLRVHVNSNPSDAWGIRTISKYYLGMDGLSESDVLKEARDAKTTEEINERLCKAYYYLGEARLFKGDRQGAAEFFLKSIDTNVRSCMEYGSSKANLRLMEKEKIL